MRVSPILDSWTYYIDAAEKHVFIVTYACYPDTDAEPGFSHEHKEIGLFPESAIAYLNMPDGYKRSITTELVMRRSRVRFP